MQRLLVWCLIAMAVMAAVAVGPTHAARRTVLIEHAINVGCG